MIEKLLLENEGKTLEFKESTKSLTNIIKTVVAFANTSGGKIVIGVEDRTKKIVGVPNALEEEERLINVISDSITPFLVPNLEIQNYQDRELIIIDIPHLAGPFHIKKDGKEKGVYVRSGSTNRIADAAMLDELHLFARKISFDEAPCLPIKNNTLDWEIIEILFKNVKKEITPQRTIDLQLLVSYAGKETPSNGGVILFGTNRLQLFPDAIIKCVRFYGLDKSDVIDQLEITDYPILALEEVLKFVRRNTKMAAQFGELQRVDIPEYPPIAVREAITNAILHADYASKGASIMIAIFRSE